MNNNDFLGLNNFVWWFGVVENRLDPLELGRCQIRCFGWHSDDINQLPIDKLPWAHPIVPYGVKSVQAPAEGTMVFGFFADGSHGEYPIIIGTVPGIPVEIRQNNAGFTDPYTDAEKAAQDFPRKIKEFSVKRDSRGINVVNDTAKRNPSVLDEPTVSRLARPNRSTANGAYQGIEPSSIANTSIDIQRKTRIPDIQTARGVTWDEPYPSYNAMYPFNNVTETESGHAFEMDDTEGYERVQLSHRTGSTLEFLPEGHTKIKSQKSRYDVTMGDHRSYVNGEKYETVDSDMYLRVNGKLRIECGGLELISADKIQMASSSDTKIKAAGGLHLAGLLAHLSGADVNIAAANAAKIYGGFQTVLKSSGVTSVGGAMTHIESSVIELITQLLLTAGIQDLNSNIPAVGKVGPTASFASGPDMKAGADLAKVAPAAQPPKTDVFSKLAKDREGTDVLEPVTVTGKKKTLPTETGAELLAVIEEATKSVKVDVTLPKNELKQDNDNLINVTGFEESSNTRDPEPDTSAYKAAET